MNPANIIKRKPKFSSIFILILLLSSSLLALLAFAVTPPTILGEEENVADYGVLHSDTYFLYPWEDKSLNIGFSKYGEMINLEDMIGLEYDGIDAFANPNVPV